MSFRQFVLVTHKWVGLASALVLAIAGVTGTLLVWPDALPTRALEIIAGLHIDLLAGHTGANVMLGFTGLGILLQAGGLYLWWKSKRLRIRSDAGFWRWSYDVHGTIGVLFFVVMLILGATAIGRVVNRAVDLPGLPDVGKRAISYLHTTNKFPFPVKVVWAIGSLGFLVQGVTGVVIWWKPKRTAAGTGAT
jgi:uncharacterized iron-regulated membrane protein